MTTKRRSKGKKEKKANAGAEPMPSLIFNSVTLAKESVEKPVVAATTTKTPAAKKATADRKENANTRPVFPGNHGAKKYMWAGVMGISATIFFLWGFAMVTKISHINIGGTPEGQLAASAKSDWSEIFEKTKAEETKKQVLNQLKNMIGQMMATATPSTTLENSTTVNNVASIPSTTILTATTTATTTLTTTTKIKK